MQRRSFVGGLAGILAAGFAPAAFSSGVGSGILMPVKKIIPFNPWILCIKDANGDVLFGIRINGNAEAHRGYISRDAINDQNIRTVSCTYPDINSGELKLPRRDTIHIYPGKDRYM